MQRFAKMSGAGNDFIVFDNRDNALSPTPEWIAKICRRGLSVGADGVMLLQSAATGAFAMRYFNADGSEAAMCGNGGRCMARFAALLGVIPEHQEICFVSAGRTYTASVAGTQVRLGLNPPQEFKTGIRLELSKGEATVSFTDTGVPHAVVFLDSVADLAAAPVASLGREIRHHGRFKPHGTNANFAVIEDQHHMRVRTYERGVEDETLACGTGVAAAVLLAANQNRVSSPVQVMTMGKSILTMEFDHSQGRFTRVVQQGEARLIYWGELSDESHHFT